MRGIAARCPFCLLVIAIVSLAGCDPRGPRHRFNDWAATPQAARLVDYQDFLRRQKVEDALPMESLLRSGRRWRRCGVTEFAVPPESAWANMVPTLAAVKQLRADGLLHGERTASAYRDPVFNRCEGGSSRSKHLANNALDFDLARATPSEVARLCAWWQRHGPALKLGLGFYDADKIHVDTSGFRTWGYDYTRKTSLCTRVSG